MAEASVDRLIDELLHCWSGWEDSDFYLRTLVPAIARGDNRTANLMSNEQAIVDQLRAVVLPGEFSRLPELVEDRQKAVLLERRTQVELAERRRVKEEQAARERAEAERQRIEDGARAAALQRRHQEDRRVREAALRARLERCFVEDFLGADAVHNGQPMPLLITVAEYVQMKTQFVQRWANEHLGYQLDVDQARAVTATDGDIRVTARAGSGKTRTLVTRAVFLVRHCGVPARSVLLLAFNRRAADDMRDRIEGLLDGPLPHVMTFHSLAYALVHPEEELVYDNLEAGSRAQSRAIQNVIDEHLRDREVAAHIRVVMLEHYREDWEAIVSGHYRLSISDFLQHRRASPRETLRGEYVKSHGEKLIANLLFEHGLDYAYERNRRWNGVNYRPDFTLTVPGRRGGIVVEYFGMRGDPDYDEQADAKRAYWKDQADWTLLEYFPNDIATGSEAFTFRLVADLRQLGLRPERLDDEEIWELVRHRALDRFTGTMASFVGRCRKLGLAPDDVAERIESHRSISASESAFLRVGQSVYRKYLDRLAELHQEDFDGLMWRASALVRSGTTKFARGAGREQGDLGVLRYVHIDEFQDFSAMFSELATGIREASPTVEFFCVGDDWQAINAFAGSDLRFFVRFDRHFERTVTQDIPTNYRSARRIVDIGNSLMLGRGTPAVPHRADLGNVLKFDLAEFKPSAIEKQRHDGDEFTPALLRITQRFLELDHDVVLLARRNGVPWYVNSSPPDRRPADALAGYLSELRSYFPEDDRRRISISTTHKYKGLENSAVIVIDALDGSYPLIHPSWVFLRIFGEEPARIEDEERRLFYVALTRAKNLLAIVTERRRESPFLPHIESIAPIPTTSWDHFPPIASPGDPLVEIRAHNAYDVRDHLKKAGYRWNADGRYWSHAIRADQYSSDLVLGQPWYCGTVEVEVLDEDGSTVRARSRNMCGEHV